MPYTSAFPPFAVTVDMVVLADAGRQVLLVRRGGPPYEGSLALPGGFVEIDESLDAAARRELAEETGVDISKVPIAQVGAYGEPDRDPRGRTVSIAYVALLDQVVEATAGDDAAAAGWHRVEELDEARLAFDHARILADAMHR
ncbi:NUDIX hydrolase [Solicola gregarius]|uniref:NUDIX hydrolase n=1 Tax=Solicola gregarius TaxID=2908642 RepID=A0AA46YJM0_9ACTN|nr:NUDIX hydrolase [Solicola gregarius]UYM04725.1 NUDIX hydrolase [Solicola gregarius]